MSTRLLRILALGTLLILPASTSASDLKLEADVAPRILLDPEPSPSVDLTGNDALRASGLIDAGRGTAEDPFVIADLAIVPTRGFGVRIQGTTDHVVLRNVYITGYTTGTFRVIDCVEALSCPETMGVLVRDAANVAFEGLRVVEASYGVRAERTSHLRIEGATLGDGDAPGVGVGSAVYLENVSDAHLRGLHVVNTTQPLRIVDSQRITIEDGLFETTSGTMPIARVEDLTVLDSDFRNARFLASHNITRFSAQGNRFFGGAGAFTTSSAGGILRVDGASFCGNVFDSVGGTSVFIRQGSGVVIQGNHFLASGSGADVQLSTDVRVERNLFAGMIGSSMNLAAPTILAHNNSFDSANGVGVFQNGADVRFNWWRDASGPSGVGPGTGEKLTTNGRTVQFEPWLEAPPATPLECPGDGRAPGTPRVSLEGEATVEIKARVKVKIAGQKVDLKVRDEPGHTIDPILLP